MSFRCTACPDRSYDKAWKLQRHIRESIKCFEQLNPGTSATRFRCSICDYTSPREEDLRRHRRRAHPDIAITTATDTGEAGQPTLGSHETFDVASCLQPVIPLDTDEHPNEIDRLDPQHSPYLPASVTKRKNSDADSQSADHKRVCIEANPVDIGALDLVDESESRETSTPSTTDNKDRTSLTTWQPTAGGLAAIIVSTISQNFQGISKCGMAVAQSTSNSGSGIGSLFGRPSTHAYEPWRTWSHTSRPSHSVRSLHSVGMPAPMLESVDEELAMSRAVKDLDEPLHRVHHATEAFVEDYDSDADMQEIRHKIQDWRKRESDPVHVRPYSCPGSCPGYPLSIPRLLLDVPSSGSSSESSSSLRDSAASAAMRPGLLDYWCCVGSKRSGAQITESFDLVNKHSIGVRCLFDFLGCSDTFTDIVSWNEHCKSHFRGKALPRQLRCLYLSCTWTILRQEGEDAWNGRMEHIYRDHDILSQSEELCKGPDVQMFQYLWRLGIINDAQLEELRKCGQLGLDLTRSFVVPEKPDRNRPRRKASRR
jgi:hypothetical protein